jgi:HD-GYP domain-containing protein (c-di-GMP phosphodiesterase class II)
MVRMTDLVRKDSKDSKDPKDAQDAKDARPSADAETKATPTASSSSAPTAETPPAARVPRLNLRALANSPTPTSTAPAAATTAAAVDTGAEEAFARLLLVIERARAIVKTSDAFPWADLERAVSAAITSLASSAELFWMAHNPTPAAGTDAVSFHQARVVVLALRVGANVGLQAARLVELGMAAALIDVGLWVLGDGGRRLDPQSAEYRTHPRVSADVVKRWGPPVETLPRVIAEHHELEHGQGYPQNLHGDAIHPHAKILSLVDRYAALTGSGTARGRSRPHEAIRDIVRSKNEEFSPPLIKALLREISVFPPGTPVRLNTGELARVIGVNRNHPLRPRVEVIADSKGQPPQTERIIDLGESPFVYVTGPATEQG